MTISLEEHSESGNRTDHHHLSRGSTMTLQHNWLLAPECPCPTLGHPTQTPPGTLWHCCHWLAPVQALLAPMPAVIGDNNIIVHRKSQWREDEQDMPPLNRAAENTRPGSTCEGAGGAEPGLSTTTEAVAPAAKPAAAKPHFAQSCNWGHHTCSSLPCAHWRVLHGSRAEAYPYLGRH